MTADRVARPNIVLTGFMGTGKTTVGRRLAVRLNYGFVDSDAVIEDRFGPIPAIFKSQGEAGFRAIEREIAAELAERTAHVVSTGGRLMLDPACAAALGASGRVFCLRAAPEEILTRLTKTGDLADRPLLAGPDPEQRIRSLLEERQALYAVFEQVDTNGHSPDALVEELLRRLD